MSGAHIGVTSEQKNRTVNKRLLQTIMFRLPDLVDPGFDISMDSTFLVVFEGSV